MSRRNTSSGRSPLLSALLSSLGSSKGDLGGISFQNDPKDEFAEDFGDKPDTVAVADHWWNKGKAESVNNQLKLSGINARQTNSINNDSALAQQQMLLPGKLEELKKSGVITNDQHIALMQALGPVDAKNAALKAEAVIPAETTMGNRRMLNANNVIGSADNEKNWDQNLTDPTIADQLQKLTTSTATNIAAQSATGRKEQIAEAEQPYALSSGLTKSQIDDAMSKLALGDVPLTYSLGQQTEKAKLDELKARAFAEANGMVGIHPGETLFNKGTGATVTTAPSDFEQTMAGIARWKAAKTNNMSTPVGINVTVPQSVNVPPATTNVPQAVPVNALPSTIVMKDGKPYKKLPNGQLVPFN